jgi:hypothetical protein
VNFKHRFNHTDQGGFPMPCKEGRLLVDGYKINQAADIECAFEHGEGRKPLRDFTMRPMVTFNTVAQFNGCDREKLRMAQQHSNYSTILT